MEKFIPAVAYHFCLKLACNILANMYKYFSQPNKYLLKSAQTKHNIKMSLFQISDLTELSHLTSLSLLEELTLANNPMIEQPDDIRKQFDYRPYVINWCLSIRMLDGIVVGAKER